MSNSTEEAGDPSAQTVERSKLTIRLKMLVAFIGTIAILIASGAVSSISFKNISSASERVATQALPSIELAQKLIEQAGKLGALGPLMASVANDEARRRLAGEGVAGIAEMDETVRRMGAAKGVDVTLLEAALKEMSGLIQGLDQSVAKRLALSAERAVAVGKLNQSHKDLSDRLAPMADKANNTMLRESDALNEGTARDLATVAAKNMAEVAVLQRIDSLVDVIVSSAEKSLSIDVASDDAMPTISRYMTMLGRGLSSFERLLKDLTPEDATALSPSLESIKKFSEHLVELLEALDDGEREKAAELHKRLEDESASATSAMNDAVIALQKALPVRLSTQLANVSVESQLRIGGFIGESVTQLRSIFDLQGKIDLLYGSLSAGAATDDSSAIGQTEQQIDSRLSAITLNAAMIAASSGMADLPEAVETLGELATGPRNVLTVRREELNAVAEAARAVLALRVLEGRLGGLVNERVVAAKSDGIAASDAIVVAISDGESRLLGLVLAGVLAALLIYWAVVERGILRRLSALTRSMTDIAKGDLKAEIPASGGDEIGAMTQALHTLRDASAEVERVNFQIEEERVKASAARRVMLEELAISFEASIQHVVSDVAKTAGEMSETARQLSDTAAVTNERSLMVAEASNRTSSDVQTVASAADELAASIAEIGRQVDESSTIAGNAVHEAQTTNVAVRQLSETAQRIGEVVKLINEIASQTNLLALNATIEAARAGDAGKGFAVVASEVKNLASQTGRATQEIEQQIIEIQQQTRSVVGAIDGIGGTISRMNEIATSIAAAVEEQGAATAEIARTVSQAAGDSNQVNETIKTVTAAAGDSGAAAERMLSGAQGLAEEASVLTREVDLFLAKVRAA